VLIRGNKLLPVIGAKVKWDRFTGVYCEFAVGKRFICRFLFLLARFFFQA